MPRYTVREDSVGADTERVEREREKKSKTLGTNNWRGKKNNDRLDAGGKGGRERAEI